MEAKQWTFVDKTKWPAGEWLNEPDKMQWTDEATGLPCLIHRGPSGALCGYVGVSETHPWFQKEYSKPLDSTISDESDTYWQAARPESVISVHGGLTFSSMCGGMDEATGRGVCHVPASGEPEHVWWFGFDCAHSGDFCPSYERFFEWGSSYRDLSYVQGEVANLAAQLHALAGAPA